VLIDMGEKYLITPIIYWNRHWHHVNGYRLKYHRPFIHLQHISHS